MGKTRVSGGFEERVLVLDDDERGHEDLAVVADVGGLGLVGGEDLLQFSAETEGLYR